MEKKITIKGDVVEMVLSHQESLGLSNFSEACRSLIVLGYRATGEQQTITQPIQQPTNQTSTAIDDLEGLL